VRGSQIVNNLGERLYRLIADMLVLARLRRAGRLMGLSTAGSERGLIFGVYYI